jgi:hypothetical protein
MHCPGMSRLRATGIWSRTHAETYATDWNRAKPAEGVEKRTMCIRVKTESLNRKSSHRAGSTAPSVDAVGVHPTSSTTPVLWAKAPGKPGAAEGFEDPKGGEQWAKGPDGRGGWLDSKGNVWQPTGQGGLAHGGPHWDVQLAGGGYVNVRPGGGS